jgi:hypothetical protein
MYLLRWTGLGDRATYSLSYLLKLNELTDITSSSSLILAAPPEKRGGSWKVVELGLAPGVRLELLISAIDLDLCGTLASKFSFNDRERACP